MRLCGRQLTMAYLLALSCVGVKSSGAADSLVYVASGVATVQVIDPNSDRITATILDLVFDLAVSPDGSRAYALGHAGFDVIDTATKAVTATVPLEGFPQRIALTPDGKFAYVTTGSPVQVTVIDTARAAVVTQIPLSGGSVVAMAPDGARAYVPSSGRGTQPGHVTVIDTAANTVAATIEVPAPAFFCQHRRLARRALHLPSGPEQRRPDPRRCRRANIQPPHRPDAGASRRCCGESRRQLRVPCRRCEDSGRRFFR